MSDVAAMDIARGETYDIPNLSMEIIGCKTNVSTKTTVRGEQTQSRVGREHLRQLRKYCLQKSTARVGRLVFIVNW